MACIWFRGGPLEGGLGSGRSPKKCHAKSGIWTKIMQAFKGKKKNSCMQLHGICSKFYKKIPTQLLHRKKVTELDNWKILQAKFPFPRMLWYVYIYVYIWSTPYLPFTTSQVRHFTSAFPCLACKVVSFILIKRTKERSFYN